MARFSGGVELAWQVAAAEAIAARHEFLEPAHLFIGLCSVEKLLSPEVKQQLQAPEAVLAELRAEWEVLATLFARAGADPARLRRRVRQATGRGIFAQQDRGKISRSGTSRSAAAGRNQMGWIRAWPRCIRGEVASGEAGLERGRLARPGSAGVPPAERGKFLSA